jgi:hypothetical protein
LFQKLSAAINALSSPRRFCVADTSKKPPQVREFSGRRQNSRLNRVEHGEGEYGSWKPEARRENFSHRLSQMKHRKESVKICAICGFKQSRYCEAIGGNAGGL